LEPPRPFRSLLGVVLGMLLLAIRFQSKNPRGMKLNLAIAPSLGRSEGLNSQARKTSLRDRLRTFFETHSRRKLSNLDQMIWWYTTMETEADLNKALKAEFGADLTTLNRSSSLNANLFDSGDPSVVEREMARLQRDATTQAPDTRPYHQHQYQSIQRGSAPRANQPNVTAPPSTTTGCESTAATAAKSLDIGSLLHQPNPIKMMRMQNSSVKGMFARDKRRQDARRKQNKAGKFALSSSSEDGEEEGDITFAVPTTLINAKNRSREIIRKMMLTHQIPTQRRQLRFVNEANGLDTSVRCCSHPLRPNIDRLRVEQHLLNLNLSTANRAFNGNIQQQQNAHRAPPPSENIFAVRKIMLSPELLHTIERLQNLSSSSSSNSSRSRRSDSDEIAVITPLATVQQLEKAILERDKKESISLRNILFKHPSPSSSLAVVARVGTNEASNYDWTANAVNMGTQWELISSSSSSSYYSQEFLDRVNQEVASFFVQHVLPTTSKPTSSHSMIELPLLTREACNTLSNAVANALWDLYRQPRYHPRSWHISNSGVAANEMVDASSTAISYTRHGPPNRESSFSSPKLSALLPNEGIERGLSVLEVTSWKCFLRRIRGSFLLSNDFNSTTTGRKASELDEQLVTMLIEAILRVGDPRMKPHEIKAAARCALEIASGDITHTFLSPPTIEEEENCQRSAMGEQIVGCSWYPLLNLEWRTFDVIRDRVRAHIASALKMSPSAKKSLFMKRHQHDGVLQTVDPVEFASRYEEHLFEACRRDVSWPDYRRNFNRMWWILGKRVASKQLQARILTNKITLEQVFEMVSDGSILFLDSDQLDDTHFDNDVQTTVFKKEFEWTAKSLRRLQDFDQW